MRHIRQITSQPTTTGSPLTGAPASRRRTHGAAFMALAAAAVTLTACSSSPGAQEPEDSGWTEASEAAEAGVSPVLLLGDSVAAQQALALRQGLAESGATFVDATSTGGGNVVGPNTDERWTELPDVLAQAEGGVVIYQLTSYDWGTLDEQQAAYDRLADSAAEHDADLLLVSMPPIQADEFYEPHMDELATADDAARSVADDRDDVEYLDASEVWGEQYERERDGQVDRSSDGIHTCPQSAARFTSWALDQLADLYPGFTPADPEIWANTGWSSSDMFHGC